jgi:DNA-binding XRE family transcriptional regulator
MTLGEHIQQLRRRQNLSQEALGERLGVSRQAVSKWETGQTLPDTGNLLAMAELFGVSADELAERKLSLAGGAPSSSQAGPGGSVPPEGGAAGTNDAPDTPSPLPLAPPEGALGIPALRSPRKTFFKCLALCAAVCLAGVLLFTLPRHYGGTGRSAAAPAASAAGGQTAADDFSLAWTGEAGAREQLSLGVQSGFFPYGTSLRLTERDWSYPGDDRRAVYHDADCGALCLTYAHITDSADTRGEWEVLSRITTIVAEYGRTPRGIGVGSPRSDLLSAYGDELIYCQKETGSDLLVRHDCYYAFQGFDASGGAAALLFYMQDGHVAGMKLESLGDRGIDAYAPDNVSRFPVKDGEPDFSRRTEPEREDVDETRAVYITFSALAGDENLSGEEMYQDRRTIFENLPFLDWQAYGLLGEAGQEDQTCRALLNWLASQGSLSKDELLGLQLGCAANLDGWLADEYSHALCNAFFLYPIEFTELLSDNANSVENSRAVVLLMAYDADLFPQQRSVAADQLSRYGLTGRGGAWTAYLLSVLNAPLDKAADIALPQGVY